MHDYLNKGPPLVPLLSQMNPIHCLQSYFFNLYPTNAPDPFKSASYERSKWVRCVLRPFKSSEQSCTGLEL